MLTGSTRVFSYGHAFFNVDDSTQVYMLSSFSVQTFLVVETAETVDDDEQGDDGDPDGELEDAEDEQPIQMLLSLAQQQPEEDAAESAVVQPSHALDHEYIEPEIQAQVLPQVQALVKIVLSYFFFIGNVRICS